MSKITASALELIGGTPLLKADRYADKAGVKDATILTKLEYLNPAGSVKDRIALAMIEDAEKKGQLKPGSTISGPVVALCTAGFAGFTNCPKMTAPSISFASSSALAIAPFIPLAPSVNTNSAP